MARPPLEVADLIRAAGDAFIERNRHWLSWKHIKVLLAIRRCRTAALGGHLMSDPVAGIVPPSRITAAAIATARSVRSLHGNAGSLRVAENFSDPLSARGLHTAPSVGPTGATEQKCPLRPPVPYQCGNSSRSGTQSETSRRGDWLLQRVAHVESETQNSSACPLCRSCRRPLARSHPLGSLKR